MNVADRLITGWGAGRSIWQLRHVERRAQAVDFLSTALSREETNMPEKNDSTERWGGPGASHEDRSKPKPDAVVKDADAPDHLSPRS